jgi:regulator of nonsense transcripts 1
MRWKRFYSSGEHRLGLLLDSVGRALSLFHKKLIFLHVDERLTVAIYVPQKAEEADETVVDDSVRLFAFTHTHDGSNRHRLAVPTKKNYRLYFDNVSLQLYELQRANSWVYIGRSQFNDSGIRKVQGRGNQRRVKEAAIESGEKFDWRASIALDKFSKNLQRHIGRVRRNGIMAAVVPPFLNFPRALTC